MTPEQFQYRDAFFHLVQKNWPAFWLTSRSRRWNQETPFCKYLGDTGHLKTSSGQIRTKFHVPARGRRRFIDFVLHGRRENPVESSWTGIVATCEFKGLARHTLFDFQPKWFPRVLEDIRKQYEAAQDHPDIEHYFVCTAVLDSPQGRRRVKLNIQPAVHGLAAEITQRLRIPESVVVQCGTHVFDDNPPCFMFIWRMRDRAPSRASQP